MYVCSIMSSLGGGITLKFCNYKKLMWKRGKSKMKKIRKEILAIVLGAVSAYVWQLMALLMCHISDPKGEAITVGSLLPISGIFIAIAPLVAWLAMGVLRVRWFRRWIRITTCGLAFVIPFVLISALTVLWKPSLWWRPAYWGGNCILSMVLMVTVFRPLITLQFSDMGRNPPDRDRKK